MPIILLWNAAAAPFAAQVGRWLDEIARSTFLLDKWLKKRLDEAERLDRISAGFPVFRFHDTGLTARVAEAQFGALLTQPVAGVGAHVERALGQWNIPRDLRAQRRSADLPLEALRVLEEMTAGVLASLVRFERPTQEMFDPRARTASDLIGLAALAFRTVGAHRDGLFAAAERLKSALAEPAPAGPARRRHAGGEGGAEPPSALPLALRIDQIVRYVTAAILVIPALSELFRRIGGDALTALRYRVLDELERIEGLAYDYRRKVLLGLRNGMSAFAEAMLQFLARMSGFATGIIRRFTDVGVAYLRGVVQGVGAFSDQLGTFWRGVRDLIDRVVEFGSAIVSIDIGDLIHKALVAAEDAIDLIGFHFYSIFDSPEGYEAPKQFPVTIGEMVLEEGAGERANRELRTAIARVRAAVDGASGLTLVGAIVYKLSDGKFHIHRFVTGLDLLSAALALPRAGPVAQPVLVLDTSGAPDLVREVIDPLRTGLTRAVDKIATGVEDKVGDVFGAAGTALSETARTFGEASATAAATGPVALVERITGDTDELMRDLFGDSEKARRETGYEPVAGAFEAWLLQGGFDTIGGVAAGYIRFVLDEWLDHIAEGRDLPVEVTPTSPRRLLERAELGRVHVPELRILARRSPLGRPLADRIAGEFREAVEGAYHSGLERLGGFAAVAQ